MGRAPAGRGHRVVGPVLHRDRPLDHRPDALAQSPGSLHLDVPQGGEDGQHVGAVDLGDGPGADAREDLTFQAAEPVGRLPGAAPAAPLLLGEGGHAPSAALVGEGVATGAGELAVGEGLLAGLGEGDETDAAESELALPAADDEALDPASGSGALDVEVETVAVCVPSDGGGTDEGGGERVVGCRPLGLVRGGSGRRAGGSRGGVRVTLDAAGDVAASGSGRPSGRTNSYSVHPSGQCWPVASAPFSGPVHVAVPTDKAAGGPRTWPKSRGRLGSRALAPLGASAVAGSHFARWPTRCKTTYDSQHESQRRNR